ncbi:phage portal protein [Curtobacterium sp. VKM Ac-1376]|uniref:phage portal protein n=1 Tax=Curtobacterium sp. VKM Ac-1376 TaxID=123312 RepID=UPI00188CA50C|nr:phage portal protein [Curtobacterium sp. VKM Ac-1376]MBF4613268.1 phage portal protein [Curtobacterium sp. VKM Ac-1376]
MSSFWSRTAALLRAGAPAETTGANSTGTMPAKLQPPRRDIAYGVTQERALTLSTVFRAVQIHATAVAQLPLVVERGGQVLSDTPLQIQKPALSMSRSRFLEEITVCLYLDGNAFLRIIRLNGEWIDTEVLDPRKVTPTTDPKTGRKTFAYDGRNDWTTSDIAHLKFLSIPGMARGLGPITAARLEIAGAIDARDYGSGWFSEGSMPNGILQTDQPLNQDEAETYKKVWKGLDKDGNPREDFNAHDVKVLGKGLSYAPLLLKPADVQFLESQQFSTTQIARLMGVPGSLFLAAVQGGSQTYANVEQDWIGYVRFSLMNVLREIEEALTEVSVRGQTVRFNIDVLLRTDTKTRYESYSIGLTAGWLDVDEVRALEGRPPLTDTQRERIAARKPTAPAKTENTDA